LLTPIDPKKYRTTSLRHGDVINKVKQGSYNERIKIESRDELYNIAETFNGTMDKLVALIQTEDEKKTMQQDIIRFLNILSAASDGDLSQKAEVTPDIFGSSPTHST